MTWVAHFFSWIVFFWWYSYAWTTRFEWSLLVFIFLIFYAVTLYLMCVVLIPSDLDEVSDFADYFMSLRAWVFAGVILLIAVDFADSAVKGLQNVLDLGFGYAALRTFPLVGFGPHLPSASHIEQPDVHPHSLACPQHRALQQAGYPELGTDGLHWLFAVCEPYHSRTSGVAGLRRRS